MRRSACSDGWRNDSSHPTPGRSQERRSTESSDGVREDRHAEARNGNRRWTTGRWSFRKSHGVEREDLSGAGPCEPESRHDLTSGRRGRMPRRAAGIRPVSRTVVVARLGDDMTVKRFPGCGLRIRRRSAGSRPVGPAPASAAWNDADCARQARLREERSHHPSSKSARSANWGRVRQFPGVAPYAYTAGMTGNSQGKDDNAGVRTMFGTKRGNDEGTV